MVKYRSRSHGLSLDMVPLDRLDCTLRDSRTRTQTARKYLRAHSDREQLRTKLAANPQRVFHTAARGLA